MPFFLPRRAGFDRKGGHRRHSRFFYQCRARGKALIDFALQLFHLYILRIRKLQRLHLHLRLFLAAFQLDDFERFLQCFAQGLIDELFQLPLL